jgi:hypothetical protein
MHLLVTIFDTDCIEYRRRELIQTSILSTTIHKSYDYHYNKFLSRFPSCLCARYSVLVDDVSTNFSSGKTEQRYEYFILNLQLSEPGETDHIMLLKVLMLETTHLGMSFNASNYLQTYVHR